MQTIKIRVRLPSGAITTVAIVAESFAIAKQMVEAQYGPGSFRGYV